MISKYVDCARTLEILKQDSGLLPKPRPDWNTFEPKEGDLAYVDENEAEYRFDGEDWVIANDNDAKEAEEIEEVIEETSNKTENVSE